MSGLRLSEIREALAEQLRSNISRDVTVRAYPPAGAAPSITVESASDYLDYWVSFTSSGIARARFVLAVDPGGSDYESSLRRLDDFLSAGIGSESSVVDALMSDTTLGVEELNAHIDGVSSSDNTAEVSVSIHVAK